MPIVQQLKELQGKINVLGSYSGNCRPQPRHYSELVLCAAWRGYSRSYFIWCQHFSFYPGVWFGDTKRMNLTFSHRSGIYHPSIATPEPRWRRQHPSQYYKLASPSPALGTLTAHTNKSYDVPENRGDLVQDTSSFAVLTSISLWDLDIEQWATKTKKFTYIECLIVH